MSVNTVANFVTAIANATPASGNKYNAQVYTTFPNGTSQVTITKNGAAYLTVVYEAQLSQFIPADDNNTGGWSVRYQNAGVQAVVDAQLFVQNLS